MFEFVSLYYIKKRLNNCFNCTMKLNERPPSSSRVLGCPASPPLRVCWLVHLRWKKKNIWHGCRKIQQEQKNRKMYVLSELLLLLLQQHRSSQIIFKQPIVFIIYYLAFSARHLGSELMIFSSADRQTRITLLQQHKMEWQT